MKIDRQQGLNSTAGTGRVGPVRPSAPTERPSGASATQPGDQVVLSSRAVQVSELQPILEALPAARAEMIQQLKERIARGEYSVEPRILADILLRAKVIDE